MLWQDTDNFLERERDTLNSNNELSTTALNQHEENELKAMSQLLKYSDPAKNTYRRSLMHIVDTFSNLMINNNYQEIDEKLLSKDCFIFVMDSDEKTSVSYSSKLGEGFSTMYKDMRITQREVVDTFIDVEKNIVVQLCRCIVWYHSKDHDFNQGTVKERITSEIFSINDHKIYKYRNFLANFVTEDGFNPFVKTHKERMLARVKEINYSLAGEPDLVKFAGLLDEKTEYRMQGWDGQRCFIFTKKNLEENFTQMQKKLRITRIVPFDITANRGGITAAYVYYLEDIGSLNKGKKYLWMSNCAYVFDEKLNIEKIIQMGELYPEDEAVIPFEIGTRGQFQERLAEIFKNQKPSLDMFYQGLVDFSSSIYRYGPSTITTIRPYKGLTGLSRLMLLGQDNLMFKVDCIKLLDVYVDYHDESYETISLTTNFQFIMNEEGHEHNGKILNGISSTKVYIESGKCCKLVQVVGVISEPVPSPFDDKGFSGELVIPKDKFYG